MLNLIYITIAVGIIVDITGFVDTIKEMIYRNLYPGTKFRDFTFKPIDCSLCLSWWIMLIDCIICNHISWQHIAICATLSVFANTIAQSIMLLRDYLNSLIDKGYDRL